MKTEKLLQDLEVLIESSSRIPMTTKRMVEEDEIMRIIDSIQESLPLWPKKIKYWLMLNVKLKQ